MKKPVVRRLRISLLPLMVITYALLIMFVGYWINTQYLEKKQLLAGIIHRQYYSSSIFVTNRDIFNYFISPLIQTPEKKSKDSMDLPTSWLADTSKTKFEELSIRDTLIKTVKNKHLELTKIKEYFDQSFHGKELDDSLNLFFYDLTNIFRNAGFDVHQNLYGIETQRITGSTFFFHSESNDVREQRRLESEKQTIELFKSRLEEEKIKVSINPVTDSISLEMEEGDILSIKRYNRKLKVTEPMILVDDYEMEIIKRIIPQLSFVAILLFVTGLALFLSYKGYIIQRRLNIVRDEFFGNITHELKIPVASAKAALEALGKYGIHADESLRKEYLKMVEHEMDRLDQLTTRVLNHARLEGKQINIIKQPIRLNTFIERLIHASSIFYAGSNVTINFEQPIEDVKIQADVLHLEGVIKNLIENSVKYGEDNVSITIKIEKKKENIDIKIYDNGPGIPEEYLDKVFDKFFRVPTNNLHNVKGHGLGLSYANLVLNLHGGTISASNPETGGCLFTLSLPVKEENEQ